MADLLGPTPHPPLRRPAPLSHCYTLFQEKEPAAFEQAVARWPTQRHQTSKRSAPRGQCGATQAAPAQGQYTPEQLQELAFGSYVGLVREQGGSTLAGYGTDSQVVRVRQTALSRLQEMATQGGHSASVRPVLVQALGDPNQAVRMQAFDQLAALGMDADMLGAAALGAGHTDIGVRGLEKMAGGGTSAESQAVLEEAMLTPPTTWPPRPPSLLSVSAGWCRVAGLALGATYEPLRKQAVDWLAGEYDKMPNARDSNT